MKKTLIIFVLTVGCFIASFVAACSTQRKPDESIGENVVKLYAEAMPQDEIETMMKRDISKEIRELEIDALAYDVKIIPAKDKAYIEFNATKNDPLPLIEITGDKMVLRFKKTNEKKWKISLGNVSVASKKIERGLKVFLPATISNVKLATTNGDTKVEDVSLKVLDMVSTSGDVIVQDASIDTARVTSTSGDMALDFKGSDIKVSSTSGDQRLEVKNCKQIRVASTSGDIFLRNNCERAHLATTSGDITLWEAKEIPEVSVASTSGDIKIVLADKKMGAKVSFSSLSGSVSTKSISDVVHDLEDSNHFTVGHGKGLLSVSTTSGDLRFVKE